MGKARHFPVLSFTLYIAMARQQVGSDSLYMQGTAAVRSFGYCSTGLAWFSAPSECLTYPCGPSSAEATHCGASSPLSNAMAGSAVACIRVDILGEEPLDLSLDAVYDRLLRLAFSGCVKFAHASPPCRDY